MPPTVSTVETEMSTPVGTSRLAKDGLFAVIATLVTNVIVGVAVITVFDVPATVGEVTRTPAHTFREWTSDYVDDFRSSQQEE